MSRRSLVGGLVLLCGVLSGSLYLLSVRAAPITPDATATVTILNYAYDPASVTVTQGDSVTWQNNDQQTHAVTFDSWLSFYLEPGSAGNVSFPAPGSYSYYCSLHPSMTGQVTVEPGQTSGSAAAYLPYVEQAPTPEPATPTPEPTATPPATATPLPTATPPPTNAVYVKSSSSYTSGSTRYVVGEVVTTRSEPVYFLQVTARFYDAANQLVAVEDSYAYLTQTAPGRSNPFKIVLFNAPTSITRYDLSLTWSTSSILTYRFGTLLSQQTRDNFGLEVFGEVRNDWPRELRGVQVAVTFYNAAGQVVYTDYGYASPSNLPSGATATYQVSTFRHDLVYAYYGVQVEGYLAP